MSVPILLSEKLSDLPTSRFKKYFDEVERKYLSTPAELEKGYKSQVMPEDSSIKNIKPVSVSLKKEQVESIGIKTGIAPSKVSFSSESFGQGSSLKMSSSPDEIWKRLDGDTYQYRLVPNGQMVDAWHENQGDRFGRDSQSLGRIFKHRETNQFSELTGDDQYLDQGTMLEKERDESPIRAGRARAAAVSNAGVVVGDRFERFLDQVVNAREAANSAPEAVNAFHTGGMSRFNPQDLNRPIMTQTARKIITDKAFGTDKDSDIRRKAAEKASERKAVSARYQKKPVDPATKRNRQLEIIDADDKKRAKAKLADLTVRTATAITSAKNKKEKDDLIKGFREAARRRRVINPVSDSPQVQTGDFLDDFWPDNTPKKTKGTRVEPPVTPTDAAPTTPKSTSAKRRERRKKAVQTAKEYEAQESGGGGGSTRQEEKASFESGGFSQQLERERLTKALLDGEYAFKDGRKYTKDDLKGLQFKTIQNYYRKYLKETATFDSSEEEGGGGAASQRFNREKAVQDLAAYGMGTQKELSALPDDSLKKLLAKLRK